MHLFPRLPALLLAGLLALPVAARADDDESIAHALVSARTWLAEIDAGHYEQSYNDAGSALRDKIPQDTWVKILHTERPLLGKLVSREEASHVLHPEGLEGESGTFLVISYHSAFELKPEEVEYVVLKHDFGGWRCVGYNFGPANPGSSSDDESASTTTTDQTLAPPTPTNGITVPAKRDSH